MNRLLERSLTQKFIVITSSLVLLSSFFFLLGIHEFAFSQNGIQTGLPTIPSNITEPNLSSSNEDQGISQTSPGFVADGRINSVIDVPNGKWLASGNWSMIVNNGNVTSFDTKMTWYNSSGTNAHSHNLLNFKPISWDNQMKLLNFQNKQTTIEGFTDVQSNGRTSWFEVPTKITINDDKIISISLDDNKTNHHFGGQPLLGIVDSFVQCSDTPGENMELLPPCSPDTDEGQEFGLINESSTFPPYEESIPQSDLPYQDFLQGGVPDQGLPGEDFSQGGQSLFGGEQSDGKSLFEEQTSDGYPSQDNMDIQPPSEDYQSESNGKKHECSTINIENVTANGFETDPSDYHPPSDAIDHNSSSWWSNNGDDPWIEIELSKSHALCGIIVEWNKGDERNYSFEISVSDDGNNYVKVFEGNNDQGSTAQEAYPFNEVTNGKLIKLTVTSTSSKSGWVSLKEISALGLS